MTLKRIKKKCLSCRNYRPIDEFRGKCRVGKGKIDPTDYPEMMHGDCCDSWSDAGQQYHIRIGWIKSRRSRKEKATGG